MQRALPPRGRPAEAGPVMTEKNRNESFGALRALRASDLAVFARGRYAAAAARDARGRRARGQDRADVPHDQGRLGLRVCT